MVNGDYKAFIDDFVMLGNINRLHRSIILDLLAEYCYRSCTMKLVNYSSMDKKGADGY